MRRDSGTNFIGATASRPYIAQFTSSTKGNQKVETSTGEVELLEALDLAGWEKRDFLAQLSPPESTFSTKGNPKVGTSTGEEGLLEALDLAGWEKSEPLNHPLSAEELKKAIEQLKKENKQLYEQSKDREIETGKKLICQFNRTIGILIKIQKDDTNKPRNIREEARNIHHVLVDLKLRLENTLHFVLMMPDEKKNNRDLILKINNACRDELSLAEEFIEKHQKSKESKNPLWNLVPISLSVGLTLYVGGVFADTLNDYLHPPQNDGESGLATARTILQTGGVMGHAVNAAHSIWSYVKNQQKTPGALAVVITDTSTIFFLGGGVAAVYVGSPLAGVILLGAGTILTMPKLVKELREHCNQEKRAEMVNSAYMKIMSSIYFFSRPLSRFFSMPRGRDGEGRESFVEATV